MAWVRWRERAEAEKKAARKTDSDLAAEVSELVGYDVGRSLVNHWFRGRREPSISEFMALCEALGADPSHILLNFRMTAERIQEAATTSESLRERGQTPEYISEQAKRLRRFKAKRRKARFRV